LPGSFKILPRCHHAIYCHDPFTRGHNFVKFLPRSWYDISRYCRDLEDTAWYVMMFEDIVILARFANKIMLWLCHDPATILPRSCHDLARSCHDLARSCHDPLTHDLVKLLPRSCYDISRYCRYLAKI
jgi:hypothetical protein